MVLLVQRIQLFILVVEVLLTLVHFHLLCVQIGIFLIYGTFFASIFAVGAFVTVHPLRLVPVGRALAVGHRRVAGVVRVVLVVKFSLTELFAQLGTAMAELG